MQNPYGLYKTGNKFYSGRMPHPMDYDSADEFDTAYKLYVQWENEHPEASLVERQPKIVCLCGSTKFYDAFTQANFDLTLQGQIVLSVGFFMHSVRTAHGGNVGITPEQKVMLDVLHKRKIDLADYVFVLNVGGYIGESTRSEIDYAKAINKSIVYLEPIN